MKKTKLLISSMFAALLVGTGVVPSYATSVITPGVSGAITITSTVPTFPAGTISSGTQILGVEVQLVKKTAPSRLPFDDIDTWDGAGTPAYKLFSWKYANPATLQIVNAPFKTLASVCTDSVECNREGIFKFSVSRISPTVPAMPAVTYFSPFDGNAFKFSFATGTQGFQPGDQINLTLRDGFFNFPADVNLNDYEFRFNYSRRNIPSGSGGPVWWPSNIPFNPSGTAAAAQTRASSAPTAEALPESARVTISPISPAPGSYTITASPQVNGVTRTCTITPPATNCVVQGLLPGVSYSFTNQVNDIEYGISASSNAVAPTIPVLNPLIRSTTDFYANLNGTDTFLESVSSTGPIPATDDFTFDFWVYDPSNRPNSEATIISQEGFDVSVDKSGRLDQELILNYRGTSYGTLAKLPQDTWVHLAFATTKGSSTNGTLWFNMNGVDVYSSAYTSPGVSISGPLVVGGKKSGSSITNRFKGRVDQVKVWDGVLNASSTNQSMHTWGSNVGQSGVSLIAHFDFNDRTVPGNHVYNKADVNHNLSLTSPTVAVPFADVKSTDFSSGKTTFTFPRSYLTEIGGFAIPSGVISFQEALAVGGGGAGGSDGGTGGGGGSGQFGSIPSVRANQILGIRVGQGGIPALRMTATNGQASSISLNGQEIAMATGGTSGRGFLSDQAGSGGSSNVSSGFEMYAGGSGGLGPATGQKPARSGGAAGTVLLGKFNVSPLAFGGGGGGGISDGTTQAIPHSTGGVGGGGEGAGFQEIAGSNSKYVCGAATSGLGASIGGSGIANTGGGGGAGHAFGGDGSNGTLDSCEGSPGFLFNTSYDGERNLGGHGGSGVVALSLSSTGLAPEPSFTVVATDESPATSTIRANWSTMADAATVRKIVQYRVDNGAWVQLLDSATLSDATIPRSVFGRVEFRVSRYDSGSLRWGEWVYSNQIQVVKPPSLCVDPMILKYEAALGGTVRFRIDKTITPVRVDWGDGTNTVEQTSTTFLLPNKMYGRSGTTLVEICGKFEGFAAQMGSLTEVVSWGGALTDEVGQPAINRSLTAAFQNAPMLSKVPDSIPSKVTRTDYMFASNAVLNDPALISWNMQNVVNAHSMFAGARAINQDLSGWNLSAATDIRRFLFGASKYSHKPPLNLNKSGTVASPLLAENMLDNSGIPNSAYGEILVHWAGLTGSNRILNVRLGAVDKTALCGAHRNALLSLVNASGAFKWTVTDQTNRDADFTCPTVTVTAASTTQTYGSPVPSVSFTVAVSAGYTGPNWLDVIDCKPVVINGGSTTDVTSATNVGSYTTKCTGPAGSGIGAVITYVNGTHTISQRPITIKVQNRIRSTGDSFTLPFTGTSSSNTNDDFVITSGSLVNGDGIGVVISKKNSGDNIAAAGAYPMSATLVNTAPSTNYAPTYQDGTLTVSAKTVVITGKNASKVYGDTLTLAADGFICAGSGCASAGLNSSKVALASTGLVPTANVGVYAITSTVTNVAGDYDVVNSNGGSVTVTKRPLYVRPNAQVVPAGTTMTVARYTYEISGFANGETISGITSNDRPTCSSGYNVNTPWGTELDITCSGGNPGSNYYFVYETATLKVPDFSTLLDLTPAVVESSAATDTTLVPFRFVVEPYLNICYATLELTYLPKNGELVFATSDTVERTNVLLKRVSVDTSIRENGELKFEVELPKGDYSYQLLLDGNCAVEPTPSSLTVSMRAASVGSSSGLPTNLLPKPIAISPNVAKPDTTTSAQITGENLADVVRVRIGGKAVTLISATKTTLDFRIPKLKAGRYDILLEMRDGTTQRWEKQFEVTGKSTQKAESRSFVGFAAGSSKLTPAMTTAIRGYLTARKANFRTIECVGYTEGRVVRRTDVPLAITRARVTCNLAASLGYKVVSRSYVNERIPGAQLRKVKLILAK